MQDVFLDQSLNGWILTPAGNLVEFVSEERRTCASTVKGYMALALLPDLLNILHHKVPEALGRLGGHWDPIRQEAPGDAAFAMEEIDAGFPTIFNHHTIVVWAAVETTMEQILVSFLLRSSNARDLLLSAVPSLKAGKVKLETPLEIRRTLSQWERTFEDRSPVGRSLRMLDALGFTACLAEAAKRDLDEMSGIRNVVLHRAGFVDEDFLEKCPWFAIPRGQRLRINQAMMDRYFNAASALAIALIDAVVKSPHIRIRAS